MIPRAAKIPVPEKTEKNGRQKFREAKVPGGKCSVRRMFREAKVPGGKSIGRQKYREASFGRQKIREAKVPGKKYNLDASLLK